MLLMSLPNYIQKEWHLDHFRESGIRQEDSEHK